MTQGYLWFLRVTLKLHCQRVSMASYVFYYFFSIQSMFSRPSFVHVISSPNRQHGTRSYFFVTKPTFLFVLYSVKSTIIVLTVAHSWLIISISGIDRPFTLTMTSSCIDKCEQLSSHSVKLTFRHRTYVFGMRGGQHITYF